MACRLNKSYWLYFGHDQWVKFFFDKYDQWVKCAEKSRDRIDIRAQCILSTASFSTSIESTTVLNMGKLRLPSLETDSDPFTANKPWTYMGAVGPPTEVRIVLFSV